ncbi:TonB-dependent siderophore receptor [uncultured Hyphomonas sp.]|uniref:TonB-dependent siderophore receptor n=1 Tax=uncultured Hyphomonas sp. TaxID=225298 RepID=UPI003749B67B
MAQTADTPAADTEDSVSVQDVVIITGMKSGAQSLQSVPSSIAVLSADQLEAEGIVQFEDFARKVAGLSFLDNGPGDKRYTIRGINSAGEAQTALYYDNSPVTGVGAAASDFGGSQPDLALYDVEQIEVLRGPQGTLYGSNSQSGVIKVVTKKPVLDEYQASAQVGLSNTEDGGWSSSVRGMVNVPIIEDKIALRLVGYYDNVSGFIDNPLRNVDDVNETESIGFRAAVQAQLTPATTLLAQVFYQELDSGGQPVQRPYDYSLPVPPIPGSPVAPNFFAADGERAFSQLVFTTRDDETQNFALTLDHDMGWSDLTVTSSLFKRDIIHFEDYTTSFRFFEYLQANNAFPVFPIPVGGGLDAHDEAELFSAEARISTKLNGPVNGVFGVYYSDRTIDYTNDVYTADPSTGGLDYDGLVVSARTFSDVTEEFAVFGEGTWDVTDKLSVTAGARWFQTERTNDANTTVPFFGLGAPGRTPTRESQNDDIILKGGVAYDLTDDVMVFAQYAEGYRAGGTNASVAVEVPPQYEPDETSNYEIGTKTQWFDGRLLLNLTAYRIDLKELQLGMTYGPGGAFSGVGNVDGTVARSEGFELDATIQPIDPLTIVVSAASMDASLTKDLTEFDLPSAVDGAGLIGVPDQMFSISADYDFRVFGDVDASVGASLSHTGDVEVHRYDAYNLPTDAYTLVDLRSSFDWDRYTLSLFVTNLTDENAQVNVINSVNNAYEVLTNRPRTIGARFGIEF